MDAQIALQFHEAREANPAKLNSRIKNKIFYGQAGGKDLLLRKWKDLSDEITVECDGKDITPKLKEHRVHSVLFANIPNFGSGTKPWNPASGEQRIDDGTQIDGRKIIDYFFVLYFFYLDWDQPLGQLSRLPEQPCWLYALIALQQHSPLPRRF